jgi:hypothetical protein
MTKLSSAFLFSCVISVVAASCDSRCQSSGCHGCLAKNNVCEKGLSRSDCFAQKSQGWCWCGSCGGAVAEKDCDIWQSLLIHDVPPAICSRFDPCSCGGATCDPNKTNPCVTCNAGHITQLNINGGHFPPNALSSTIPCELAQLPAVINIALSNNSFKGTIPSCLSQLSQLESLSLHRNALTGSIPSSFGQLSKLTSLNIFGNYLSGKVPSLPFSQYEHCILDSPPATGGGLICTEPHCNHFACPLPQGSGQCERGFGAGKVGVHCQ